MGGDLVEHPALWNHSDGAIRGGQGNGRDEKGGSSLSSKRKGMGDNAGSDEVRLWLLKI